MSRWLMLLACSGALLGCANEDSVDDGAADPLAQVLDAAVITPTSDAGAGGVVTEVGKACMADSDCKAPAAKCQKQVSIAFAGITIDYPGGYCTTQCKADAVCGAGAACPMASMAALMPALSACLKICTAQSDCRNGYSCAVVPPLPGSPTPPPGAVQPKHCLPPLPI